MRNLYIKFFKSLASELEHTDNDLTECYTEACKNAMAEYIESRNTDDIDVAMLRDFVDYVKRMPSHRSHNVIPLKNNYYKQH